MISYFGEERHALKANLHTHTTNSDGRYSPDEIIGIYAGHGYDVLALTDHHTFTDPTQFDPKGMIMIPGAEIHPKVDFGHHSSARWHILALNVNPEIKVNYLESDGTGQDVLDDLNAHGAIGFVAHPNWCGYNAKEVNSLTGYAGIEIYNTSCVYIGREDSTAVYNELIDNDVHTNVIAVDDTHSDSDLFGGWTTICAKERTLESVVEALRTGAYYASCGPEFSSVEFKDGVLRASFTPAVEVAIMIGPFFGIPIQIPGHDRNKPRKTIESFEYDLKSRKNACFDGRCLRLYIRDEFGRTAWMSPIWV